MRTICAAVSTMLFVSAPTGLVAQIRPDKEGFRVKGWSIGPRDSGCVAAASFKDGTTLSFGTASAKGTAEWFIAFSNTKWSGLVTGREYKVKIDTGSKRFDGTFTASDLDKEPGLLTVGLKETFIEALAAASGFTVVYNGSAMARLNMVGSSDAIRQVRNCNEGIARLRSNGESETDEGKASETSAGTGFVVDGEGTVVTNEHVVSKCSEYVINVPGSGTYSATILGSDRTNDIAILRSEYRSDAVPSIRSDARIGEDIAVYGFPLPDLLAENGNFTRGNITALAGLGNDARMLQIQAPVQKGNSGGPLVDQSGNVVGVVVAKLDALAALRKNDDLPQNVNFSIKGSLLKNFLDAYSIQYKDAPATKILDGTALAELSRRFTVQVLCRSGAATSKKQDVKDCSDAEGQRALEICSSVLSGSLNASDKSMVLVSRGFGYLKVDKEELALLDFAAAEVLSPRSIAALFGKAVALRRLGRYDQSLSSFDKAASAAPDDAFIRSERGYVLLLLEKYVESLADQEKAIRLDPKLASAWNNKGLVLKRLGRYEDAIKSYSEALKLNPKSPYGYLNRARAYASTARQDEALADYQKAISLGLGEDAEGVINEMLRLRNGIQAGRFQ